MLLADHQIRKLLDGDSGLVIEPFQESRLRAASYDLTAGDRVLVSGQYREIELEQARSAQLQPGEFAVIVTRERFEIPQDMVLNIGPKTYLIKKGIVLQAGMQVDPGFKGHLVVGLYNSSPRPYVIEHHGDLCSVQFFKLSEPAKTVIREYPQMERGEIPRMDKEYLYSLETKSLSSLGQDVRSLTQSVAGLTNEFRTLKIIVLFVVVPVAVAVLVNFLVKN